MDRRKEGSLLLLSSLDLGLGSALDLLLSSFDFLLWLSSDSWLLLESVLLKELVINCIVKRKRTDTPNSLC